jgi:hypothetical protein
MPAQSIHHVRHHAEKHHEAHMRLKELLKYPVYREKVWHIFLTTFFVAILSVVVFLNWGKILDFFTPVPKPELPEIHGFQSGVLGNYKIDGQASDIYKNYLAQIPSSGHLLGIEIVRLVGDQKEKPSTLMPENAIKSSVWLTNMLSTGQHMTKLEQGNTRSLQKSMLATYYLGEKTVDINSTLETDTQLLSKINNALAVDIFQFLNQSENRADTLTNYTNLLSILLEKCDKRIQELQYKIDFLNANFQSQEVTIKQNEQAFFDNLKMFNGPNAEGQLGEFIGVREAQVEVKAKIGAYQSLQDYYKFFRPTLENLITAIKANRDPLIAGVKVVEIQDMTLPLIIKQK